MDRGDNLFEFCKESRLNTLHLITISTGTFKAHYSLTGVTVNQSILILLARDKICRRHQYMAYR